MEAVKMAQGWLLHQLSRMLFAKDSWHDHQSRPDLGYHRKKHFARASAYPDVETTLQESVKPSPVSFMA
ncbi:MAG: hypothetical protein D6704_11765 [Nitrospirae bacterium]|nr:MAG: hypothetical protein D6704_11765 [Nitrospirota bacterium]